VHHDDRTAAAGALVWALIGAGLVLLTRVLIVPAIQHVDAWVIPPDAWVPLRGARSVANGDVFHLYEPRVGRTGYPYTPALPILLAPIPWIGDRFALLGDVFYTQRRPAMFLLLGPAEAIVGTFPIVYVAGRALAGRAHMFALQGLVFLTAAWAPVAWFHPEDTIACALLLAACLRVRDGDWRRVGIYIGLALLFKQWALWPAIPIIAAAPKGRRALTGFYAFVLPAIVMVPFLLASSATMTALTNARASLQYGQPQLWLSAVFGGQELANADLLRLAWGAATVLIAWRVWGKRDVDATIAAVGAVMLVRLVVEPVLFGYYLVPATVLALVWCARRGYPIVLRAITAAALTAFCMPHTYPQPVFFAMLAFGLGYVCGPMVASLFPQPFGQFGTAMRSRMTKRSPAATFRA
jgi:hypothetical protein